MSCCYSRKKIFPISNDVPTEEKIDIPGLSHILELKPRPPAKCVKCKINLIQYDRGNVRYEVAERNYLHFCSNECRDQFFRR